MITTLNNMTCAGSTSTAMGLWYGYDQLVSLHQPAALNVILLFTDGQPTGVYVKMPLGVIQSVPETKRRTTQLDQWNLQYIRQLESVFWIAGSHQFRNRHE